MSNGSLELRQVGEWSFLCRAAQHGNARNSVDNHHLSAPVLQTPESSAISLRSAENPTPKVRDVTPAAATVTTPQNTPTSAEKFFGKLFWRKVSQGNSLFSVFLNFVLNPVLVQNFLRLWRLGDPPITPKNSCQYPAVSSGSRIATARRLNNTVTIRHSSSSTRVWGQMDFLSTDNFPLLEGPTCGRFVLRQEV
jgi:hypothetical protein